MAARPTQQAGSDPADQNTDGERRVQSVHDADAMRRLETRGVRVDGDVEQARRHPHDEHQQGQLQERPRKPRQRRCRAEENKSDRDEAGAEQVRQPSRREHRRQSGERNAEQGEPELGLARTGLPLDRRQARRPAAPEQPEDGECRRQPAGPCYGIAGAIAADTGRRGCALASGEDLRGFREHVPLRRR